MVRISLYQALLSSCYCRSKLLYIVSFVCYFVICLLFILISAILLNKICTKGTYLPERSLPFWPVLLTIRRWYIVYFSVQTPKMSITNNIENRESEFLHSGVYSNSLSVNEVTEISRCSHLPSLSPTLWLMFFVSADMSPTIRNVGAKIFVGSTSTTCRSDFVADKIGQCEPFWGHKSH